MRKALVSRFTEEYDGLEGQIQQVTITVNAVYHFKQFSTFRATENTLSAEMAVSKWLLLSMT